MDFRAALFDFDGVIVNSTPTHLKGWQSAYWGMFKQDLEPETLQSLVGRSTAAIGRILAERSGYPAAKPELIRRKQIHVFDNLDTIELIEGAREFLEELRKRSIPYGIVSNAPRDFIGAAIAKHQLPVPFFLGLDDYHRPKPDAEPYVKGAVKLGFPFTAHGSILVFEDSTHGIEAAIAAHMIPIGICSQHAPEILFNAGAQLCFEHMREAARILPS
ncbi:MAG TPA: HAD hydrolase-like protein [Oligoflexus sp.]|uniref:HAD family hydrolase n=1 Tax=Oligoflexus sp. TaxID=1971216 RepID=UPI002D3E03AF|nr:HAD hydrolase-like protein [Oligoflexus sp.]HYX36803.1 HAD hydrolase-like protein [Oligoflexus sp.]